MAACGYRHAGYEPCDKCDAIWAAYNKRVEEMNKKEKEANASKGRRRSARVEGKGITSAR